MRDGAGAGVSSLPLRLPEDRSSNPGPSEAGGAEERDLWTSAVDAALIARVEGRDNNPHAHVLTYSIVHPGVCHSE